MSDYDLNMHRQRLINIATAPEVLSIIDEELTDVPTFLRKLERHDLDKTHDPDFSISAPDHRKILANIEHQKRCMHHPAAWDKSYSFNSGLNEHCDATKMPDEYLVEYALDFVDHCNQEDIDPIEAMSEEPIKWSEDQFILLARLFFAAVPVDRPWPNAESFVKSMGITEQTSEYQHESDWQMQAIDFFSEKGRK
jgi:hypothetical protein